MTRVLGHRGLRQDKDIDENSLAAIAVALQTADGAEIDVSVSADGTPYVVHDLGRRKIARYNANSINILNDQLNRPSRKLARGKRMDELHDATIDRLRLKKGAKLPKLSEVFALAARHPGKTINIELKGQNSVRPVIDEISKAVAAGYITEDQIIITSFDHAAVLEARRRAPELKCGVIFSTSAPGTAYIYPWGDKSRRYKTFNAHSISSKTIAEINPDYVVMTAGSVTREKVRLMKQHCPQAKLAVWSSREEPPSRNGQISRLLDDPDIRPLLDTVISDFPEKMKKKLKTLEK